MTHHPERASLVERLDSHMGKADMQEVLADCRAAAAEIERLTEREKALKAALEPFAAVYAEHHADLPPEDSRHAWGFNRADLTWGDFHRAAAIIKDQSHD